MRLPTDYVTGMQAQLFAQQAHGDQRYGDQPYTYHLKEVVRIVVDVQDPILRDFFLAEVAWLHDVLEDTSTTRDELEAEFGYVVASAVALVTDPEGKNRRERKAALHARLEGLDELKADERAALLVKAADRYANVVASIRELRKDLLKMYRDEHPEFRKAVWREGLAESLWDELDQLLGA